MRKSALLLVGAALLICLGAFALSGSRSASAATTPNSDPAPTVAPTPTTPPPPVTNPAPPTSASTAPPATSPSTVVHHQATTPNPPQQTAPPPTVYQPSYTTYPYTTYPYTTYPYSYHGATTSSSTSSTSTTSTTSTTIAGIEGKISNSPQTVPLATKGSNGHVSGVFPILAYVGFGLAVLIVLIRLFITRPGGPDRRPGRLDKVTFEGRLAVAKATLKRQSTTRQRSGGKSGNRAPESPAAERREAGQWGAGA